MMVHEEEKAKRDQRAALDGGVRGSLSQETPSHRDPDAGKSRPARGLAEGHASQEGQRVQGDRAERAQGAGETEAHEPGQRSPRSAVGLGQSPWSPGV